MAKRRCGGAALTGEFSVGIADIDVLIGLYFAPGVALALPGGAIGQKFGDRMTASATPPDPGRDRSAHSSCNPR
jgi:hypothetical protein